MHPERITQPVRSTKTDRRKLRSTIRGDLGVSHQGPTTLRMLFRTARHLDELLRLTSAGRYRLVITAPSEQRGGPAHVPGWAELTEAADQWIED